MNYLQIRAQWGGLWVIGGDFNVTRFMHEKNRPNNITRSMRDFNNVINQCDLRDSPLLKAKFTWTDRKENPLLSRLDRFLVSNCWEEVYPHFSQEAIFKLASDHWPVMLNTSKVNYGPITFCFENIWVTHPQFMDCIRVWWHEAHVEGYEGFRFMKKLQHLKQRLRVWNKNTFGLLKEKKESIWSEVESIDQEVMDKGHLLPPLKVRRGQLLTEMECIL